MEPGDFSYDPNWTPGMTHVLQMPTAGDKQYQLTRELMGRISGLFGSWKRNPDTVGPEHGWREIFVPNPTYGQPTDELLIDRYVMKGDPRFARFRRTRCTTRLSTTSTTSVMALLLLAVVTRK